MATCKARKKETSFCGSCTLPLEIYTPLSNPNARSASMDIPRGAGKHARHLSVESITVIARQCLTRFNLKCACPRSWSNHHFSILGGDGARTHWHIHKHTCCRCSRSCLFSSPLARAIPRLAHQQTSSKATLLYTQAPLAGTKGIKHGCFSQRGFQTIMIHSKFRTTPWIEKW